MANDTFNDRALAAQAVATPWLTTFIDELLKSEGDVEVAAEAVHVSVPELHELRRRNKVVQVAWANALDTVRKMRAQKLETLAFHEAAYPPRKYKFTPMGKAIEHPDRPGEFYYEEERDNRLVLGLLKALDRDVYGERTVVTGKDGGPIQHAHIVATLADIVRTAAGVTAGTIAPDTVVGEIPDDGVVDAEIVP
jgi:hypothetical protein